MKHLIIVLFLCINLTAKNYISEDGLNKCKIGEVYTVYTKNKDNMHEIPQGFDCETWTIQDVEVDNPEDEKWALKEDFQDCTIYPEYADEDGNVSPDDCRYLVRSDNIGTMEEPIYAFPLCSKADYVARYAYKKHFPETFPDVTDDSLFAYCTKFLGYGKKIEKRLLEDATLKAAKEAAEAQKLAEEQAKELEKSEAINFLKDKKGKVDKLSKADLDLLIEKILILLGE